uniref:Protein kinase domain-containing protein n=1 Tax=Pinguiococcus pyrenoidosus TaxID=172671 RepID=A0A7R9U7F0_9STRA
MEDDETPSEMDASRDGNRGSVAAPPAMLRPPDKRPVHKLSVGLISTYKMINRIYYTKRALKDALVNRERYGVYNDGYDDENWDYIIQTGEVLNERYEVKERIGKGSFGQVIRAEDRDTGVDVAIKIIKSKKPFMMQAKVERELLCLLRKKDRNDEHHIVKLLHHFVHRGHQCLVFEMLSYNLYELLKNTQLGGVSLNLVKKFARQILKALNFLSRDDVDVIHCDLKPENILLCHPKRSTVKVIDFGSSCHSQQRMYQYIQSRFYRSPEVLLGLRYSTQIDMWSLGCILVEMHTGEPLFGGSDQQDQMARIVEVFGMPPEHMLREAPETTLQTLFERDPPAELSTEPMEAFSEKSSSPNGLKNGPRLETPTMVQWKPRPRQRSSKRRGRTRPRHELRHVTCEEDRRYNLAQIIGVYTHGPGGRRKGHEGHTVEAYESFLDFIMQILEYDPDRRIRPAEALQHPLMRETNPPLGYASSAYAGGASATPQTERAEERKQDVWADVADSPMDDGTLGRTRSSKRIQNLRKQQGHTDAAGAEAAGRSHSL